MKVIPVEGTNVTLPDVAKLAKEGTVILTKSGKPVAAIRDVSGSDWESISLAANPQFRKLIEDSRRSFRERGGIGLEELRAELGLKKKTPRRRRRKNA